MFPFVEKRNFFDDYGQTVIEIDDFAFEDVANSNQKTQVSRSIMQAISIVIFDAKLLIIVERNYFIFILRC